MFLKQYITFWFLKACFKPVSIFVWEFKVFILQILVIVLRSLFRVLFSNMWAVVQISSKPNDAACQSSSFILLQVHLRSPFAEITWALLNEQCSLSTCGFFSSTMSIWFCLWWYSGAHLPLTFIPRWNSFRRDASFVRVSKHVNTMFSCALFIYSISSTHTPSCSSVLVFIRPNPTVFSCRLIYCILHP